MKVVAIHQPNFMPWLGFFDKLARVDCFVMLDSVALQLGGSGYTNRVRMIINGTPSWVTVPVMRGHEARERINAARIADSPVWRRKLTLTIEQSYRKAPFFSMAMPIVEKTMAANTDSLCEMNLVGIYAIAEAMNVPTNNIIRSSAIEAEGRSTELLANLVRAVGGDVYLAGHGAADYQDNDLFAVNGIAVEFQRYRHPVYPQLRAKEFATGMSAIDALMNCGSDAKQLVGNATARAGS